MTRPMSSGVYAIPNIECRTTSVVTNTTPTDAYRGAGRPEATAAIERAMDLFAAEIGMDPAEVRRINLIPPFSEPHTTVIGQTYDVGDYVGSLDRVLDAAGVGIHDHARPGTGPVGGVQGDGAGAVGGVDGG